MRIFTYLILEFIAPLSLSALVFLFILVLDKLFTLVNLILVKGVEPYLVYILITNLIPTFIPLTLPLSFFIASLLTFARLSEDNEFTAFRASGVRVLTLVLPILIVSFITSGMMTFYNATIMPQTQYQFKRVYAQIVHRNPTVHIEAQTVIPVGEQNRIYVKDIEPSGKLNTVLIYRLNPGQYPTRIVSQTGERVYYSDLLSPGLHLVLNNGYILEQPENQNKVKSLVTTQFNEYKLTFPYENVNSIVPTRSLREFTSKELKTQVTALKLQGQPVHFQQVEINLRTTLSFACFAFVVLGIPFGIRLEKASKSIGFGLGIILMFIYYLLLITAITLGERQILPPGLALSIPNTVIIIAGLIFARRWRKE